MKITDLFEAKLQKPLPTLTKLGKRLTAIGLEIDDNNSVVLVRDGTDEYTIKFVKHGSPIVESDEILHVHLAPEIVQTLISFDKRAILDTLAKFHFYKSDFNKGWVPKEVTIDQISKALLTAYKHHVDDGDDVDLYYDIKTWINVLYFQLKMNFHALTMVMKSYKQERVSDLKYELNSHNKKHARIIAAHQKKLAAHTQKAAELESELKSFEDL